MLFSCQHNQKWGHIIMILNTWLHPMIEYIYCILFPSILFIHISSKSFLRAHFTSPIATIISWNYQLSSLDCFILEVLCFILSSRVYIYFLLLFSRFKITPPFLVCTENEFLFFMKAIDNNVLFICLLFTIIFMF